MASASAQSILQVNTLTLLDSLAANVTRSIATRIATCSASCKLVAFVDVDDAHSRQQKQSTISSPPPELFRLLCSTHVKVGRAKQSQNAAFDVVANVYPVVSALSALNDVRPTSNLRKARSIARCERNIQDFGERLRKQSLAASGRAANDNSSAHISGTPRGHSHHQHVALLNGNVLEIIFPSSLP